MYFYRHARPVIFLHFLLLLFTSLIFIFIVLYIGVEGARTQNMTSSSRKKRGGQEV